LGRNSVGSLEINFHVKIHEPPKILHFTETLNVNENETAKLLCVVKGQPSPSISILQDGVAVLTTARIMQTSESLEQLTNYGEIMVDEFGNGVSLRQFQNPLRGVKKYGKLMKNGDKDELRFEYVIPQVRRVHNGTYSCVVMNALGSGRAESAVIVHGNVGSGFWFIIHTGNHLKGHLTLHHMIELRWSKRSTPVINVVTMIFSSK
jgi:Immunoglobulin domain